MVKALGAALRGRVVAAARAVLRDTGCAIGVFTLINVAGELVRGPFDTIRSFVGVPESLRRAVLPVEALLGALLILHCVRPLKSPRARMLAAACFSLLALVCMIDVVRFYQAVLRGVVRTSVPVPNSIVVFAFFAATAWDMGRGAEPIRWTRGRMLAFLATSSIVAAALPLLLMFTFGPTNYARSADCAVVFGARVWDDGTPSLALSDRVDEAIRLYQTGLVSKLVMSGAIDQKNHWSEPAVMRARAVEAGVREADVLMDEAGVDTASTVRNTATLMRREGFRTALAVSHYYHEPRIKMLFDRAGVQVYTVPAKMTRRLLGEPWFLAREVLAYYHSFLFE